MNQSTSSSPAKRKCLGLVRRKQVWALTWRGWLVLLLALLGGGYVLLHAAHPFLAVHAPIDTPVLVLEGWVPEYAATGYVARCSPDTMIYTVGGPTIQDRHSLDVSDTHASVGRARLVNAGFPPSRVMMVPCWDTQRDRTYSSAVALRDWSRTNHVELKAINVATFAAHARRSRLLFQKAFGPDVKVGIISLPNDSYDSRQWWRYSEGFKEIVSEGSAYLYVRFLFSPETIQHGRNKPAKG
jgi:uncharacterized SAM-binding protein YcdF (DUF218 family)